MPKRKDNDPANESVFSSRFCQLMDSRQPKLTQEELGKILGVSKSSISFYRDGTNQPNYSILIKIAKFFNCSADYLLGLSDCRELDPELRMICEYFGLSEHAVKYLHQVLLDPHYDKLTQERRSDMLSGLIESDEFPELLDSVRETRDKCQGIGVHLYNASPVDSLSDEELKEEAHQIKEEINAIGYRTFLETTRIYRIISEITDADEVLTELKERMAKINRQLSKPDSDRLLQQFVPHGDNKTSISGHISEVESD